MNPSRELEALKAREALATAVDEALEEAIGSHSSLGPLLERYFLRAMQMSQGDLMVLFSSNLANVLWVCLILSIAFPYVLEYRRNRRNTVRKRR